MNGKYYAQPPPDLLLPDLFTYATSYGIGRPVDEHGYPDGLWTPVSLCDALCEADPVGEGVSLRAVQIWFSDNKCPIGLRNIRALARIFGCQNAEAVHTWQAALSRAKARSRLSTKTSDVIPAVPAKRSSVIRKTSDPDITVHAPIQHTPSSASSVATPRFSLATWCSRQFSGSTPLNMITFVWMGWVALAFSAYIFGVHNVSYAARTDLLKQVGFLWAPNWTVLELALLPAFINATSKLGAYWTETRPQIFQSAKSVHYSNSSWLTHIRSFEMSYWVIFFVCFVLVFGLQWSTVHLSTLLGWTHTAVMIDWSLIASVRPDVISTGGAIGISMLGFFYTGCICFIFLAGLIHNIAIAQDFHELLGVRLKGQLDQHEIFYQTARMTHGLIYQSTLLGIWIASCIKIQAVYLVSDASNIISWFLQDLTYLFGTSPSGPGSLEYRSVANLSSFLLLFSTCVAYILSMSYLLARSVPLSVARRPNLSELIVGGSPFLLLISNFLLVGLLPGFSVLMILSVFVSIAAFLKPPIIFPTVKLEQS